MSYFGQPRSWNGSVYSQTVLGGKQVAHHGCHNYIQGCEKAVADVHSNMYFLAEDVSIVLGGCPFNGPLSGTKYPTRAASPIQNASTPKSSLPFSRHRSCALLCTVVRRF